LPQQLRRLWNGAAIFWECNLHFAAGNQANQPSRFEEVKFTKKQNAKVKKP